MLLDAFNCSLFNTGLNYRLFLGYQSTIPKMTGIFLRLKNKAIFTEFQTHLKHQPLTGQLAPYLNKCPPDTKGGTAWYRITMEMLSESNVGVRLCLCEGNQGSIL